MSEPMFESVRNRQTACSDLLAWEEYDELTYTENGQSRLVSAALVNGSAFRVLGGRAELGSLLDDSDVSHGGGGGCSADVSYECWPLELQGGGAVIGLTLV